MPSFCVVSNCEYKYTHSENVSFHRFPIHSTNLLAKWVKFADRGNLWRPSRWSSICSRHFLPSDFRDYLSRKCLKKDAIPSVTMKQFNGNFLDLSRTDHEFKIPEIDIDADCRLCGLSCKSIETFATNFEVYGMIQKCFPTLNINLKDNLPKNLCSTCLQRLQNFSDFIDDVLKTQKDLEAKFVRENNNLKIVNNEKQLKIKQEPVINVKQEISEGFQSLFNDVFENALDEDQEPEQKSHFLNLPVINSQEIINNCDIMEIISLDIPDFIDIPDDEIEAEKLPTVLESKVNCHSTSAYSLSEEHNYARNTETIDDHKLNYKTEDPEESDRKGFESGSKPNLDIVVIDESIVKPLPIFDIHECDICHLQFLSEQSFSDHKNSIHQPQSYSCSICDVSFTTFRDFLSHKTNLHRKNSKNLFSKKMNLPCSLCGKVFPGKLALNNHTKYICNYQKDQIFECKYCTLRLNKWSLLRKHEKLCKNYRKNNPSIQVSPKPIRTRKRTGLQPNEAGQFVCSVCGRTYSRRHNLFKHQRKHRPVNEWNFKCGDCEKLFDHIHDLRRHFKNNECAKSIQRPDHILFVCTICGKQLKSLQRLKIHSTIHSVKKPYVCESCGKAFKCFNNLYQHRVTHTDIRRYKCDLCEKVFKRPGGLNQHKKAFHLKLKPHECNVCKHKYALKGDMMRCKHSVLKN